MTNLRFRIDVYNVDGHRSIMAKNGKILVVESLKINSNGDDLMCKRPANSKTFACARRMDRGETIDVKSGIIANVDNVTTAGLGVMTMYRGEDDSTNIIVVPVSEAMSCNIKKRVPGERDLTCKNMIDGDPVLEKM